MTVHGRLRELVAQHGERVLHSTEDLRGLLDDYFTEGELSSGELNLLVDAVRLHAFDRLEVLLAQGADPRTAVEAAGLALAQERSGDVRSAAWACAALGHAVGKIPADLVVAYDVRPVRPGFPQGAAQPPPQAYQPPTSAPPPPGPPVQQSAARQPAAPQQPTPPAQPPGPQQPAATTYPAGGRQAPPWQQQPASPVWQPPAGPAWQQQHRRPEPPKRTRLLLVAAGAVAALIVLAVAIVLSTRGDGTDPQADDDTSVTDDSASDDTTTPSDDTPSDDATTQLERSPGTSVTLDEVAAEFASLGSTVAADATRCEVATTLPGTVERLRCRYQHLRVTYSTYEDEDAFDAARSDEQQRYEREKNDQSQAKVEPAAAFILRAGADTTSLYWDAGDDLRSGYLEAPTNKLSDRAAMNWFDQRGEAAATRELAPAPEPFESDALWELARYYVGERARGGRVRGCEQVPIAGTVIPQSERVMCSDGAFDLTFVTVDGGDIELARDHFSKPADSEITWDWVADEDLTYPTAGAYMLTYGHAGDAVLYWDDTAQGVYGLVSAPDGSHERAESYWATGDAANS